MKITTILMIFIVLFMVGLIVSADLSDETKELVDYKVEYYYQGELFHLTNITSDSIVNPIFVDDTWSDDFLSIKVEGDKLIIETQDGKWFIKMEKE